MIERIASGAVHALSPPEAGVAASPARRGASVMVDGLSGADVVGTPLRQIAGAIADHVAASSGRGDPVGIGRLERATLDFGREAKAFAIGHPELDRDTVRARLDDALAGAEIDLPPGDPLDRAISLFERATARLSR